MTTASPSSAAAAFTVPSLSHVSWAISSVSSPVLHPVLLPISPLVLLHALRVSMGTTSVQGGPKRRVPLLQSVVLDLILLFGGWSVVNAALGQPNPLLDAGNQWVALVYGGVHAVATVTGVNAALLGLLSTRPVGLVLDLALCLVDAICRMDGIAQLGVEPVRSHAAPLTPLLTSTLIGGGAPLLIGLFNLNEPSDWRLRTPDWLVHPAGLLGFDLWSSAFVGWLYLALSSPTRGGLSSVVASAAAAQPILSRAEAGLFSTVVLAALMLFERLRVEASAKASSNAASSKKAKSGAAGKNGNGKAAAATRRGGLSTPHTLLYLGIFVPLALFGLQTILAGNDLVTSGWVERVEGAL